MAVVWRGGGVCIVFVLNSSYALMQRVAASQGYGAGKTSINVHKQAGLPGLRFAVSPLV